jgi:hypothetical protein
LLVEFASLYGIGDLLEHFMKHGVGGTKMDTVLDLDIQDRGYSVCGNGVHYYVVQRKTVSRALKLNAQNLAAREAPRFGIE